MYNLIVFMHGTLFNVLNNFLQEVMLPTLLFNVITFFWGLFFFYYFPHPLLPKELLRTLRVNDSLQNTYFPRYLYLLGLQGITLHNKFNAV